MVKAFNLPGFNEFGDLLDQDFGETDVESDASDTDALLQFHADQLAIQLNTMVERYITDANLHLRCPIHLLQLSIKDAIVKHCAVNSVQGQKSSQNSQKKHTEQRGNRQIRCSSHNCVHNQME